MSKTDTARDRLTARVAELAAALAECRESIAREAHSMEISQREGDNILDSGAAMNIESRKPENAPWLRNPSRLWSLAEMMPADISRLTEHLNSLVVFKCMSMSMYRNEEPFDPESLPTLMMVLTPIRKFCLKFGMMHSEHHCEYIRAEAHKDHVNLEMLVHHMHALETAMVIDISTKCWLYLEPWEAHVYARDPADWYGVRVWKRFPNARYDLAESEKCFALERYTAAVFHSIRPLELAVRAVWRSLYKPGTTEVLKTGWTEYQRAIDKYLANKGTDLPPRPPDWTDREKFYQQVQGHINTVTRAWRHRVMHMESHYGQPDCAAILDSCHNLFVFIAKHLTQRGVWRP